MEISSPGNIPSINEYPLFFQPQYFTYLQSQGKRGVLFASNGIVIPVAIAQNRLVTTGKILYTPVKLNDTLTSAEEKAFVDELVAFIKKEGICDYLESPLHICTFQNEVGIGENKKIAIMQFDLTVEEGLIFKAFSQTYRTQINKCTKEGFKAIIDSGKLEFFYSQYSGHHKKQGIYYDSYSTFSKSLELLGDNADLYTIVDNTGTIQTMALIYKDKHLGLYMYGARNHAIEIDKGVNKFLHWSIMQDLIKQGLSTYVIGGYLNDGSAISSLNQFKLKFNPQIEEGYHFNIYFNNKYKYYLAAAKLKNLILRYVGR